MLLVHKIELAPNNKQATFFARACGVARFAWNWALAEWQRQYEAGEKPNEAALRRQLNAIKAEEYPWMLEVSKSAPQQAIKNLGAAFQHFFRRVKRGEQPGFPRFKKRGIHDSFRADNGPPAKGRDAVAIEGRKIRIPKLGLVRMREALRFQGQIKSVVVSRTADKWFASIAIETGQHPNLPRKNHGGAVGVDLGIEALAVLSSGETITGPKPHKNLLRKLRRLNRSLSRKQKGSANREKAKRKLARVHYRIACIRKDALHKLTTRLATQYDAIGIEDLNVRGMVRNRHLSRAIMDQSFHEFRRQLEYKADWHGATVAVADRFFPSTKRCSSCGTVHDMPLSRRVMRCDCGLEINRDLNAAINLEQVAASSAETLNACGEEGAGLPLASETGLCEAGTQQQTGSGKPGQVCVGL
jgi:putative transposase